MIDRRALMTAAAGAAAASALPARAEGGRTFPPGFLWGAATAGEQVEGNNDNSDAFVMETVKPTLFAQPAGDADNSFELWGADLDLVKAIGLNSYRFSLEWARIEPAEGLWSTVMLDHYKRQIEGCRARGLTPVVTFNHFAAPRWFSARGGWTAPEAPGLFARFCDRAARHMAADIGVASTLNEPNITKILQVVLPPGAISGQRAMLQAAGRNCGSARFVAANVADPSEIPALSAGLLAGHRLGREAIKAVRPDLPVGVNLSMFDDEAVGPSGRRDAARQDLYGAWMDAVKGDDFLGVQNYERVLWGPDGRAPPPPGAIRNDMGGEVYAPSLANAVRYAHQASGVPIMVTEHGVGSHDDALRARLIPAALTELHAIMAQGVPVKGYMHWSLLDSYEWLAAYGMTYGLCSVDRTTFKRTPKPSAAIYGAIARRNAV